MYVLVCTYKTAHWTKVYNQIHHVATVVERHCSLSIVQSETIFNSSDAALAITKSLDQSSNHCRQRSRIFARDATAYNINVVRRTWLFLVAVVIVCECFVAHSCVSFNGTTLVLSTQMFHNVFYFFLEKIV